MEICWSSGILTAWKRITVICRFLVDTGEVVKAGEVIGQEAIRAGAPDHIAF